MMKTLQRLRPVHLLGLVGPLALILAAVPSAAQGPIDSETIKVEVPFDFVVGETSLPAGTYEIEIGKGKSDPPVLVIQTHDSEDELRFRRVMALASPGDVAEGSPRLVFSKVGEVHFLEKVVPDSGKVQVMR